MVTLTGITVVLVISLIGTSNAYPRYNGNATEDEFETSDLAARQTSCQQCICGMTTRWTRIVGGTETMVHEYPWMAALATGRGKFFCGGTLINDRYILTAAHCVSNKNVVNNMKVVLSEHDVVELYETMTEFHYVDVVIIHPRYKPKYTVDNDLALIRLKAPVVFRYGISAACLPTADIDVAHALGTVAGWGALSENGPASTTLQAVKVPILTQERCLMTEYSSVEVTPNMFCAGNLEYGGIDSCKGDSGGSLLIEDGMMRTIAAGVVSWGNGCAQPNRPGVYTRVSRYLQWIEENTRDACSCT